MLERDKRARENIENNLTQIDRQNLGERENILTRIETTRSEPIFNSVVSTEKIIHQTCPRVMIMMTRIHRMTVIIDASDAGARNIGRRTQFVYVQL